MHPFLPWIVFAILVICLLVLDLGVFNRKAHVISTREATIWTAVWVGLAVCFNIGVYIFAGKEAGLAWTTGYLIEKALSIDNIFVFLVLMAAFRVPAQYQHKLLYYGVVGALIMRGTVIAAGTYVIQHWHNVLYVFGAFLIYLGVRMLSSKQEVGEQQSQVVSDWMRSHLPMHDKFVGTKLFVANRKGARPAYLFTPFLAALACIELTDLIFAVDSIPAIFAITEDPFIIFTSNVFAILGLRSLYFVLAHAADRFHYLKYGLGIVLSFVGIKMLVKDISPIPIAFSLAFIAVVISFSVWFSLRHPKPARKKPARERTTVK